MAATALTMNKLKHARRCLFWIAQAQGNCPYCEKPLLPNHKDTDVDDITVDHLSRNYDHANRVERGEPAGVRIMHKTCHKVDTAVQMHSRRGRIGANPQGGESNG